MVIRKNFAYHTLVAVALIVPAWGCNTDIPEAPAEAKEAEKEAGTEPPKVDLGTPAEPKGDGKDSGKSDGA